MVSKLAAEALLQLQRSDTFKPEPPCRLMCRDVAFPGTLAVLAAWWLGLDAFGGFHWDYRDVSQGIIAVAPLCFLCECWRVTCSASCCSRSCGEDHVPDFCQLRSISVPDD